MAEASVAKKRKTTTGQLLEMLQLVDEAEKVAQQFGIMSIPTLMVFKNGKEVSKKVGLCSKEEIMDMISL